MKTIIIINRYLIFSAIRKSKRIANLQLFTNCVTVKILTLEDLHKCCPLLRVTSTSTKGSTNVDLYLLCHPWSSLAPQGAVDGLYL